MTGGPPSEQRLQDLARLRRVRDRMDREYAQPLDADCSFRDPAGNLVRIQEVR